MIQIKDLHDCCGCGACAQGCPKQCIQMVPDKEGFLYPQIDKKQCVDCGLCEKICPFLNISNSIQTTKAFAAYNPNPQARQNSSSGGIFSLFAEWIIQQRGVVFGASFNSEWKVVHTYITSFDELRKLQGSKYVQSNIEQSFKQAKSFLDKGEKVLFSGTPCQISGLNHFLKKEYPNLFTIDFICHGVPSPLIWKLYLEETISRYHINKNDINAINFRNKDKGWKNFQLTINNQPYLLNESIAQNIYLRAFLSNLILRPSCHSCRTKSGCSKSDITIGDFWKVEDIIPEWNDNKGISAIIINSEKGERLFSNIKSVNQPTSLEKIIQYNIAYTENAKPHPLRERFFTHLNPKKSIYKQIEHSFPLKERLKRTIKNTLPFLFK